MVTVLSVMTVPTHVVFADDAEESGSLFEYIKKRLTGKREREPRCYLWGYSVASSITDGTNFATLGNLIRMNFDADSLEKCRTMINAYCRHNILDNREFPKKMRAFYRPKDKPDPTHYFKVGMTCNLEETARPKELDE